MSRHRVRIVQGLSVRREIVVEVEVEVEVEADSLDAALDKQAESDAPDFDDPRWQSKWSLRTEDVHAAGSPAPEPSEEGENEDRNRFINFYKCEECGHEWQDEWSCTCEDDCPECSARHMTPRTSEDAA